MNTQQRRKLVHVLMVVLALLWTRAEGLRQVVCLDQQEPTSQIVLQTYIADMGDMEKTHPHHDFGTDVDVEFTGVDAAAKVLSASLETVCAIICLFVGCFMLVVAASPPTGRTRPLLYHGPPRFSWPPLRAPPA